jgi:ribosomal-protein-alanine N-acetyltransferase
MQRIYKTDRLMLKVLDGASAMPVLEYFDRNRAFLEEWEPTRPDDFYTLKYHAAQLNAELALIGAGTMFKLWIFKKEEEGRVIGSLNFGTIVRSAFQSCYMGYRLDGEEINRGYMTEAVRKGIDIMFNDYKLHRIEANVIPRNARSLKVVRKLGFREEGLAKDYLKINGIWEDHIHMVLLNENMELGGL